MQKNLTIAVLFCLVAGFATKSQAQAAKDLVLWYNQPAKDWNEALPLGNGRLGAMVFGRVSEELIQLNEATLWTGGPVNQNANPDAPKYLQPVRDALFKNNLGEATKLLRKIQGPNSNMYQPLGDVVIKQSFAGSASNYKRSLNISNATTTTTFSVGDVTYTREIFVSAPNQVIVIRLKASQPKALQFSVHAMHDLAYQKSVSSINELTLRGKARIESDSRRAPKPIVFNDAEQCKGMRFQFTVKTAATDGTVTKTDTSIVISNATEAVLYIAAATSFNGFDKCPDKDGKDENQLTANYLLQASKKSYAQLLDAHVKDYTKFFNRVQLNLSDAPESNLPTDKRLAEYAKGQTDVALEELYYQFGRYLLISCSRPSGQAANLQGIWNKEIRPSWGSNYTTNINLQMNYWAAEAVNLSEMTAPLTEQIRHLAINGAYTAKNYYNMRGWAVHHNSDIWALTNPIGEGAGDPKYANWALGSPWLSQHLFEHYQFTGNKAYLKDTAYPLMKGAAEFCIDWLVEKDGYLVTAPSTSPENVYVLPNGSKGTVTIASGMDMEIIWDIFTNTISAAKVLGVDKGFVHLLVKKRSQLHPLMIGHKGNLQEWYGDWEDGDPQHRHVSHLFGLHPGHEISPLIDTSFANAARKTLEIRGDGGTGWSKAWKINFWARLLDGDHSYKMYKELLKTSTLNNLFDKHPPFQIDGNFGAVSGITEMLLQSHLSQIQLLPALPTAWAQQGHVKGLIARGGFVIEMFWKAGILTKALITSKLGNTCSIRTNNKMLVTNAKAVATTGKLYSQTQYIQSFPTVVGKTYEVVIQ